MSQKKMKVWGEGKELNSKKHNKITLKFTPFLTPTKTMRWWESQEMCFTPPPTLVHSWTCCKEQLTTLISIVLTTPWGLPPSTPTCRSPHWEGDIPSIMFLINHSFQFRCCNSSESEPTRTDNIYSWSNYFNWLSLIASRYITILSLNTYTNIRNVFFKNILWA